MILGCFTLFKSPYTTLLRSRAHLLLLMMQYSPMGRIYLFFYGGNIGTHGINGNNVPHLATWRYDIRQDTWSNKGFGGTPIAS